MKANPLRKLSFLLASVLAFGLLVPALRAQSPYTMTFANNTGLDPSAYSVYLMGLSTTSSMALQLTAGTNTGTFQATSSGAALTYYKLGSGTGEINQITFPSNSATALSGARVYLLVVQNGATIPSLTFPNEPPTPPATYPPYTFVEITVPATGGGDATVDVQAVDGFTMPITITENGQFNVAGSQYGQPVYNSGTAIVNRSAILTEYQTFMTNLGTAGAPYLDLLYASQYSVEGTYGGILSPRTYLAVLTGAGQPQNVGVFDDLFNDTLNTLFGNNTMKIRGVASGAGEMPNIAPDTYTVQPVSKAYPGTSVSLPALEFTGVNVPANVFYIYNPVGVTILTNDAGTAITGTLSGSTLTVNGKVSDVAVGMYVGGVGMVGPSGDFEATVATVDNSGANTVVTLNNAPAPPAANSQFLFSKLPYTATAESVGWMVLAQNGFFNDGVTQFPDTATQAGYQTVLNGLENFLSTAINRGVATLPSALTPNDPSNQGLTSQVWADQSQWYPAGTAQNLYAKFMHTATLSGQSIFFQPANPISGMGAAYAFPYDENSGPTPPATDTTEVPSKFDQNVAPGSTIQVTLGQWGGPAPAPGNPTVTIDGKKKLKISKGKAKITGSTTGSQLFVKYKKKPGKVVTKKVNVKGNGSWVFKFKPQVKNTVVKFYAENASGQRSAISKVKVIDTGL